MDIGAFGQRIGVEDAGIGEVDREKYCIEMGQDGIVLVELERCDTQIVVGQLDPHLILVVAVACGKQTESEKGEKDAYWEA